MMVPVRCFTCGKVVGELLAERDVPAGKGDEGAWAPSIGDGRAFELLAEAVDHVADEVGFHVGTGVDMAAAELYEDDAYQYSDRVRLRADQVDYVVELVEEYDAGVLPFTVNREGKT